jgi:hypothetical protein
VEADVSASGQEAYGFVTQAQRHLSGLSFPTAGKVNRRD